MKVMDWIGLVEILIIIGSLFAIFKYSLPDKVEPKSTEDFNLLMLEHIDKKLGPVEKNPNGLLKKEYALQLQKIIVYFNTRAG
jgi:hypothetical protein